MVVREDEDLRLAGQAAKGARVQDAVAVALEAGPEFVRFLFAGSVPRSVAPGRAGGERGVELFFTFREGPRSL